MLQTAELGESCEFTDCERDWAASFELTDVRRACGGRCKEDLRDNQEFQAVIWKKIIGEAKNLADFLFQRL